MDIKEITEIIVEYLGPFDEHEELKHELCEDAAKEILDKIQETFIQEIAGYAMELKPNSIFVLYSNEPHAVRDTLFSMRKMVRERFPELKSTSVLILSPGDDIRAVDEKQMNELGWIKINEVDDDFLRAR